MTDDLVKRLRSFDCITMDGCGRELRHEAAARIEQLEAGLQKMALEYLDAASKSYQAQLKAEAKLAKAVEMLDRLSFARTTLAELKGEDRG
jgi:hypothetical protein